MLLCDKPALTTNVVTWRELKSADLDSLKNDLAASGLCQEKSEELTHLAPEEVDALLTIYKGTLSRTINRHALLKENI